MRIGLFFCIFLLLVAGTGQTLGILEYDVSASLIGLFIDIDVGPDGRAYLLGAQDRGVVTVYSPTLEKSLAVFDLSRSIGKPLSKPSGIAVADDGSFWVTDQGNGSLLHFDALGFFLDKFQLPDNGPVTLKKPGAVSMTHGGALVVADRDKGAVLVVDAEGELSQYIKGSSQSGIRFSDPVDIAVDPVGYIHVVDGKGGGMCRFDPGGVLRDRWGSRDSGRIRLPSPVCIAADDSGLIYVVDSEEGRCLVSSGSEIVATFGTPGSRRGQIGATTAIVVSSGAEIMLADQNPARVQVFSVPSLSTLRQAVTVERRFMEFRALRSRKWPWDALRVDLFEDDVVILDSDRKTIYFGSWVGCPGSLEVLKESRDAFKDIADICLSSDGMLYVADQGHRRVFSIDLWGGGIEEVASPKGRWKRPVRLCRTTDEGIAAWDDGDKTLSFIHPTSGDRSMQVNQDSDIIEILETEDGDIILVPSKGALIRIGQSGSISPEKHLQADRITAAYARGSLTIGFREGGLSTLNLEEGQRLFFGVRCIGEPFFDQVVDLTAQDSLLVAVYRDGGVGSFVLHNLDRSGLEGELIAQEEHTGFRLLLEPVSSEHGGRRVQFALDSGPFNMEGIFPGLYRWSIVGRGWQTCEGQEPLWLRQRRVASLGTIVMKPAGSVSGSVAPSHVRASIHVLGPDSTSRMVDTDAAGAFSVSELLPGNYRLEVVGTDFKPDSCTYGFSVRAGAETRLPTIHLTKLGSLKGVIKPFTEDEEVWVLRDGRLVSVCAPEPFEQTHEDSGGSLGRYSCDGLESGDYTLLFRARGFYPDTLSAIMSLSEGAVLRCGEAVLHRAPAASLAGQALDELQRAVEDYSNARFVRAEDRIRHLLDKRMLPYGGIERAARLLGWCAIAQGGDAKERAARQSFRLALLVNPWVEPGIKAPPKVARVLEEARDELFGETGPPEGVFRP